MRSIRNRFIPFPEAYEAYAERVAVPVSKRQALHWLTSEKVYGLKQGRRWTVKVTDLVRHHCKTRGDGVKGNRYKPRMERITPVVGYELDFQDWYLHVVRFLEGREVVRPRQICDLVGVPQDKLPSEVGRQMRYAKELLTDLGWAHLPEPHSYDWAPVKSVRRARKKKARPPRKPAEVAYQRKVLLHFLRQQGTGYTSPELEREMGLTRAQMRLVLHPLVEEGKILYVGTPRFAIYYHP